MCGFCCGGSEDSASKPRNPLKHRGCTDILFLLIFILFWAGMIYITAYSIVFGNALRIVYGYDSYGNTCGMNNAKLGNLSKSGLNLEDKGNVFFLDVTNPFNSLQLCVKKCPGYLFTKNDVQQYAKDEGSRLCDYDIEPEDYSKHEFSGKGPCPKLPVLKSVQLLNRCVPDFYHLSNLNATVTKIIGFLNADDIFRKVLSDLYTSWKEMLALCAIACGLGLSLVFLIRFVAAIIVWLIMILAAVGSIVGTGFLWWTYIDIKNGLDKNEKLHIPLLDVDVKNEQAFLVFSIIATVLTVILLLIMLVMRKRVKLVVALFHEAGDCLMKMPCLLIQPVYTFLILMAFFMYWIIVLGYLSTTGKPVQDNKTHWVHFEERDPVRYMWWYHLVGLIWTSEFILACQQMVIAGSVATWYFTRDKERLECPIGKSTCRLISYHIGSLALGAFIITLVKLPRLILMYIKKKFEGKTNQCAQCCLKCCICCLWCLEKCLKFLNQNAYTVIAIEGTNFCTSARKAFQTLVSNVLRVAAINSVGDFVLFLGKIAVMATTGAIGVVWLKDHPKLHNYGIPVILVSLFSYFIAHCLFSIYEMVIDTLLLCFCEDCQMNDGTEGREYYMSTSLMFIVKDSTVVLNNINKKRKRSADEVDAADLSNALVDEKAEEHKFVKNADEALRRLEDKQAEDKRETEMKEV